MILIENWRQSWRLWSVRASALGAAAYAGALAAPDTLSAAFNAMPAEFRMLMPGDIGRYIAFALFAATLIARLVKQREHHHDQ